MKYAIISDLHGNLPSLEFFQKEIYPTLAVDKVIFLGDTIGVHPNPEKILNILLEQMNTLCIMGNNDLRIIEEYSPIHGGERKLAQALERIKSFENGPVRLERNIGACHGSPGRVGKYIMEISDTIEVFRWMKTEDIQILFHGHTHIPVIFYVEEKTGLIKDIRNRDLNDMTFSLKENKYFLINPGSIGQPRDGSRNFSFAVFDSMQRQLRFFQYG